MSPSLVELDRLQKRYGTIVALAEATARVDGKIIGLLGPNGAGKSTLLKALFGYLRPWAGSVLLEGQSLVGLRPDQVTERGIGFVAQAGGLDRLARLPASTVQVLGAERAFFEHLRGRAPPPRHGLLFLHPQIQSAPKSVRGKLARALAGKVAIAARRDREGSPVLPELKTAFERREAELRARRGKRRPAGGSALPLDGAPRDG